MRLHRLLRAFSFALEENFLSRESVLSVWYDFKRVFFQVIVQYYVYKICMKRVEH